MNNVTKEPLLEARGITKTYGSKDTMVEALKGIDLTARKGQLTGIVGSSGSGKTTLLQILGSLDTPDKGELLFQGRNLSYADENELNEHRNKNIGFIFQFHHLLPEFTAMENVMMPVRINGKVNLIKAEEEARELLARVGLSKRISHLPGELSGGEQQRVALARALIMKPQVLLADEPTGNLDTENGHMVFSLLKELCSSLELCVIMVTHNLELAEMLDVSITLRDGRIVTT